MDSKIGLLAAVIALALVGCGDDKGMARWTESTPAQVNAFGRMVSLLEEAQCLPPEVAGKLRPLEGTSLRLISSLSKADQESICDGGRELLESVQSAQTLPLFEGEEIAFDADGDGCIESLFNLNELAVATYDANSDGCFDRIWDFENALNDLAVDDSVKGELAEKARLVIAHMLPPTAEQMPDSGTPFDWPEYRAQAEVRLDELLLAIDGAAMRLERCWRHSLKTPGTSLSTTWATRLLNILLRRTPLLSPYPALQAARKTESTGTTAHRHRAQPTTAGFASMLWPTRHTKQDHRSGMCSSVWCRDKTSSFVA